MFLNRLYPTTALEDWVTNLYTKLKIIHPKQINEDIIARKFGVFLHRKPLPAYHEVVGRYRGINIDSREPIEIQREMFFHELCHILRHSGVQSMMSNSFRELQEWDANHFTRYAAIPHHLLRFIDLNDPYIIDTMSQTFKVTHKLCEERLKVIKKRLYTNKMEVWL